jgi:2-oxoisovalerate dehydrogenase E1 component
MAVEATDPLLRSAAIALESGLMTKDEIARRSTRRSARSASPRRKTPTSPAPDHAGRGDAPLAPYTPEAGAGRSRPARLRRASAWRCSAAKRQAAREPAAPHLAIQINQALHDLFCKYPETLLFGEDVAQKGGVYTVTKGLHKAFKNERVFNTLLDETIILGLAQGYANMGMLPMPEIQYLAYFHNACDQIRGEACELQFFSNDQYRNPMVMRIAGLGYQRGFGGHFHNDNSITALRDIPGLVVGCPSRGDDAAMMLRTLMALAKVDGRVCAFLEPIALYMTKDLYETGDGLWLTPYPAPDQAMPLGEGRVYAGGATSGIFSFGNGVPMSLRAAREIEKHGWKTRVVDLRWLQPLNEAFIAEHAASGASASSWSTRAAAAPAWAKA